MPDTQRQCSPTLSRCFFLRTVFLLTLAATLALTGAGTAKSQDTAAPTAEPFLWLEAEQTTERNLEGQTGGWGRSEFLSNGNWLQISIPEDQVEQKLPEAGGLISYTFEAGNAGNYQVWNRIGYEFVRSPFEWRLDNGPWKTIAPTQLTTDLMELQTWNEIAWLQLGEVTLSKGSHTLQIRLPLTRDDKGKIARVLYASDALCLTAGKFYPNGKHKPGESGRDARDQAAEKQVFQLPEVRTDGKGQRTSIPLAGDWEVCRNDEQLPPFNIAQPMLDFPEKPFWKAIPVPSDKNESRPDLVFAHRLWYRTRVHIPASHAGRSFFLTFPRNSLNTTVSVNGVYCGFEKNPNVRFSLDITKGIKPGQINEIRVGIRDTWYAYSTSPEDPMKLRTKFNIPLSFVGNGFQDLAYPVWHAWQSGILQTPVLTSAGRTYVSDVFVQPDVERKQLKTEITVTNPDSAEKTVKLELAALDNKTGAVVRSWPGPTLKAIPGYSKATVISPFPEARLWWPVPDPQLYRLRVTVSDPNTPTDISDTRFGFREWGAKGKDFTLNGMVWHGWADLGGGDTPQAFLKQYRDNNQRFFRLMGYAQGGPSWLGLTPEEALDFADENGMVVRRSGDLDGEAIGYMAIENDPRLKALYGTEIKQQLIENWRDQMVAQVKAERNHPSIQLWSVENEWLYINCINLYGGLMDKFEAEVKKVMDAVAEADPTRLSMVDGGGAGKDQLFPVHGDHYVFGDMTRYPELAYQPNPTGGGRGRWVWDQQRPRYLGEDFYANGINPADFAVLGGEETFQGKSATREAAGLIQTMLTEGYRWAEYGAWHFWLGADSAVNQYKAFAPLAVFCREWDSAFAPGQKVQRTLGIFNDTFESTGPIQLKWTLLIGGKQIASDTSSHTVAPGTSKKLTVTLPMPEIRQPRAEGAWHLVLSVDGKERFRDARPITVLNPQLASGSRTRVYPTGGTANNEPRPPTEREVLTGARTGSTVSRNASVGVGVSIGGGKAPDFGGLSVYDPQGEVSAYLKSKKVPFTTLSSLAALPSSGKVLLLGRDALTTEESSSSRLTAWASQGRTVIALEQQHPLKYQALPASMEPDSNQGRTAFIEDESHPVFTGLKNRDFFVWAGGEVVYNNAYEKPTRGAKSLLQCDNRLSRTALAEIPTGKGLILVSQLRLAETLSTNPVSRQLLHNLLDYGAEYKLTFRPVLAAVTDPQLRGALDALGVTYNRASDPLKALVAGGTAVIEATPAHLKILAAGKAQVDRFTGSGGQLVLLGLTPEGLADYNKIVGVEHMIRPFRRERVTLPARRPPVIAGLSTTDIVLSSGERINNFTSDVYLSGDAFSYVVDYDEVASFARLPEPSYWGYSDASNDHNPYNMVNGFYSSDAWQLIFSIWAGEGGKPQVPLVFPRPQEIVEMEWAGNAFYYPTKQVELTFDGGKKLAFETAPNNQPQTFAIPPGHSGREILVRIAEWSPVKEPPIVGIDNLRLKAKRSPEFYRTVKPLLNIGAMMLYERGQGSIVLCNVKFLENETVPENKRKKQNILATLLRNLKAPFGTSTGVIAGAPLQYTPLDLSKQANQYRSERGWFGDQRFTFKDLPTGRQTFAGVPFQIYDFPTSPVPTAIMLGGPGVPNNLPERVEGIPVNRKADALFFLHTARMDKRRNPQEIQEKKQFEMARYVITYADGQTALVPLYAEIDLEHFRQEKPRAIPGAQLAWHKPYDGTGQSAVAYLKQWDNPRPEVAIKSIALEYGPDRRGVPVLLAVTAASAR